MTQPIRGNRNHEKATEEESREQHLNAVAFPHNDKTNSQTSKIFQLKSVNFVLNYDTLEIIHKI